MGLFSDVTGLRGSGVKLIFGSTTSYYMFVFILHLEDSSNKFLPSEVTLRVGNIRGVGEGRRTMYLTPELLPLKLAVEPGTPLELLS